MKSSNSTDLQKLLENHSNVQAMEDYIKHQQKVL